MQTNCYGFCRYALSEGDFRSGNYVRRLIRRSHYTTVGQTVCATVAQCEHYVRQFVKQFVQLSHSVNAVSDRLHHLQYADDAAIPSHTAAGLQCSLDLYSLPHISVCVDSQHKENGSLP